MEIIDYLRDPQLVASIQQFFGVRIHYPKDFDESTNEYQCDKNEHACTEANDDRKHRTLTYCNQNADGCDINNKYFNGYVKQSEVQKQQETKETDGHKRKNSWTTAENPHYTIINLFWYYLFLFGTELGDEIFYSTFIPFCFWNIDGAVGRRVVLVWAIIMTTGQALKDILCWPRPACPPAVKLQSKWSQEYGMPSTHAMISVSIPFSVVLYTANRYIYPVTVGYTIAFFWCILVSMSRLYLGMHTVLDVIVGILLAIALMIPLVPLIDVTDFYIVTNFWFLAMLIAISIFIIVYYPCSEKWTPTRGDTTMVVSVTAGVHVGTWLNYYTGIMSKPLLNPPYHITWPTYPMFGRLILRTVIGFCSVLATRVICKLLSYATMCAILQINYKELMKCQDYSGNKNKVLVDLVHKYVTCFMIGANTVYVLPHVFSMIGVERPMFYMEI